MTHLSAFMATSKLFETLLGAIWNSIFTGLTRAISDLDKGRFPTGTSQDHID
jgi:hypothetical protein